MNCTILAGLPLDQLQAQPCLPPGDPLLVDYWAQVGETLAADPRAKASPELTALAFWLRRPRLEKLAAKARGSGDGNPLRLARGTVLHVTPANVEAMFAYSLCLAHLCGNRSIVRLPTKRGPVAEAIVEALYPERGRPHPQEAPPPPRGIADGDIRAPKIHPSRLNTLVGYGRDNAVTADLSAHCDTRVIWGGDATVREVGGLPLPPRANEIRFADRFSMALLHAGNLPTGEALDKLCTALWADISAFDQLACSCPRLLVWVGPQAQVAAAQAAFWPALAGAAASRRKPVDGARAVDRRVAACRMAAAGATAFEDLGQGRLTRVGVPAPGLIPALAELHPGGGLLLEGRADSASEAAAWLPDHGQTVVAAGLTVEENLRFAKASAGRACRIVPPGFALDFGPIWDGHDLFAELTRTVALS